MRPPLRVGTVYDFRNTPESGMDMPSLYAAIMDQVVMLDGLGLDLVWFTEHHFLDDGYLPSWVPMAGAIAARTKRVRLSSDVCLLPFNHPVRLAEDLAVLDNISNGRIEVGVGMGYAPHEFRGFGLPVSRRVSLTDEGIEVLRHCFTGEKFSFHGKRYDFEDVVIRPRYVQPGGPPLWIAAMSEAGAQRAARYDSNFLPQGARGKVLDPWRAATPTAIASVSSAPASSPTTPSATGRRCAPPSAIAARSIAASTRTRAPPAAFQATRARPASRRHGWSAMSSTA